jgi:hypothetical protein
MMENLKLAQFISGIKLEIEDAMMRREKSGNRKIPPLIMTELKIEAEIQIERSGTGEVGWDYWVVAKGSLGKKEGVTHRVTLSLAPFQEVMLGNESEEFIPKKSRSKRG